MCQPNPHQLADDAVLRKEDEEKEESPKRYTYQTNKQKSKRHDCTAQLKRFVEVNEFKQPTFAPVSHHLSTP